MRRESGLVVNRVTWLSQGGLVITSIGGALPATRALSNGQGAEAGRVLRSWATTPCVRSPGGSQLSNETKNPVPRDSLKKHSAADVLRHDRDLCQGKRSDVIVVHVVGGDYSFSGELFSVFLQAFLRASGLL